MTKASQLVSISHANQFLPPLFVAGVGQSCRIVGWRKKNSKTKDMIHYWPSCRSLRFAFGENRLHRIGGVFRTGPLVFVLLCGCLRSTGLHLHRTIVVVEREIVRMEGGKQHHVPKHFKPNFPVLTRCRRCVNEVSFCWPPNIQVE